MSARSPFSDFADDPPLGYIHLPGMPLISDRHPAADRYVV